MLKTLRRLPRLSEKNRIDELINNPSTTVKDLLFFDIAVDPSKIDIRILRYFLSHFEQFISCLLAIDPIGRHYQVACARILLYHLDFFLETTEILSIFYDYAFNLDKYSEVSYNSYFYILQQILFVNPSKINETLRKEFQNPQFFEILFSRLDIESNFYFLIQTIMDFKFEFRNFLRKCTNLFNIVINSIFSDSPKCSFRAQIILFNLLKTQSINKAPEHFLKDGILDKLIQSRIDNPSNSGFLFLKELFLLSKANSSQIWSIIPNSNSAKWKKVSLIIESYFGQFCNFIIECDIYNSKIDGCCKLCLTIFSHQKKINQLYITCLEKICQMFFNFPTNTFLHQSFYLTILKLKSKNLLNQDLINKLDLNNRIIECYRKRDTNVTSSFWGHLRLISELITNSKMKKNEEWKEIVIKENKRRDDIIKRNYGGFKSFEKSSILIYIILIIIIIVVVFLIVYNIH